MKITDIKQPFDFAQGDHKIKITDIRSQVKRADRFSIFGDNKYLFSLSQSELVKIRLKINQEISPEELNELKDKAVLDKAYDRSLNLLSRRPRSEWELRDYLKRKDYEEDLIDTILNLLSERGLVDDQDFAKRWIENRRLLKATSKRRLSQELRQKRVSDEIISAALEADETDEKEVLKELIARKRKQTRYQDDMKLMQYLNRQGYNYADIKSAMQPEQ